MINPYCDSTPEQPLSEREQRILDRIRQGDQLHIFREYMYVSKRKSKGASKIVNSFYWNWNDHEEDFPVWMLLRRGLIRPTGVGGGAQWFVINEQQAA